MQAIILWEGDEGDIQILGLHLWEEWNGIHQNANVWKQGDSHDNAKVIKMFVSFIKIPALLKIFVIRT